MLQYNLKQLILHLNHLPEPMQKDSIKSFALGLERKSIECILEKYDESNHYIFNTAHMLGLTAIDERK